MFIGGSLLVRVLGVIHGVTPRLLSPGMSAQRTVDETLYVSLLHLQVCLHLDVFGDVFPVTEPKHLHSIQESCVLPDIPVTHRLGAGILLQVNLQTGSPPAFVLDGQDGGLGEYGEISIVGEIIFVAVLVSANLRPRGETLRAEVEILTGGARDSQTIELIRAVVTLIP